MTYIWQQTGFPDFSFQTEKLVPVIEQFTINLGELNGFLQTFQGETKQDIFTEVMLAEALKTSEIEGEYFSREDVMSSLKANLGIKSYHGKTRNRKANSIALLMIEVQKNYNQELTLPLLLKWHKLLMEGEAGISAGQLRKGTEPMQVISGKFGDIKIHFEAPPSSQLDKLVGDFVWWYQGFEAKNLGKVGEAMVFSALSHLYFETLHPFEDGNGRIGRALAEKALAERLGNPVFISISKAIEKNRAEYYQQLKNAQRGQNITDWVFYFCNILVDALSDSKHIALFTLQKSLFFEKFNPLINERELKAIRKMMDAGTEGFIGGMTAKKYVSINKTSKATATRDLQHLSEIGAFVRSGGGRSVSYHLNLEVTGD